MEIFIFPELFYPLILANIMSPVIWQWRDDPWFDDIENRTFTYKTNRIKQYIIQNYIFNLDLSTWGLTSKKQELDRFADFFDISLLKQSNALFGYEGDKYYFDIDIRRHFGLDKFDSEIIPYWKTETIEAMTAFRHKENFSTGAGECVSLSALYAAAMFIIGRVPLDKIFLVATPLHSQNFITEREGLITNNRRIVTKNMWYNGSLMSARARRALENERVTIVSHISGYIHLVYRQATIDREMYGVFTEKLKEFLNTPLTDIIFINFLRFKSKYKSLFQYYCRDCSGMNKFIALEKVFEYEHTSRYNFSSEKRMLLLKEIHEDDFGLSPYEGRIVLNDFERILTEKKCRSLDFYKNEINRISGSIPGQLIDELFEDISRFISLSPVIPDPDKDYSEYPVPAISVDDSRETISDTIQEMSSDSELARLTLYVYRQMDMIEWLPFIKAAIERNPVCHDDLKGMSVNDIYHVLTDLPDQSIYDQNRLAQPDEVWNFSLGDGTEKAILLANYIISNDPDATVSIQLDKNNATLKYNSKEFIFKTYKNFRKEIIISGKRYLIDGA
ncbi:MAG TPA: hypothetical protein VK861_09335, partial [Bacteroidales bacterium]|nr:hypothetical protein [Bacteroidales bacterium]